MRISAWTLKAKQLCWAAADDFHRWKEIVRLSNNQEEREFILNELSKFKRNLEKRCGK